MMAHAYRVAEAVARLDTDTRSALDHKLLYLSQRERLLFDSLALCEWAPRRRIARQIWGDNGPDELAALQVTLSRLRSKLRAHSAPWRVESSTQGWGRLRLVAQ